MNNFIDKIRTGLCAVAILSATAASAAWSDDDIIRSVPAGETKDYSLFNYIWFPSEDTGLGIAGNWMDGAHRTITYCDNGDVYISEPFTAFTTKSYLKGSLNGNKIEVTLPQAVYNDKGEIVLATKLKYNSEIAWFEADSNQTVTFNVKSDGSIEIENADTQVLGNIVLIGLCNDEEDFSCFADSRHHFYPMNEADLMPEVPDGLTFEENWSTANAFSSADAQVAFADNGDVYVKGIYPGFSESVVKGHYDKDARTVTFKGPLYLGRPAKSDYYTYLMTADVDADGNPSFQTDVVFEYDGDDYMVAEGNLMINQGTRRVQVVEYVNDMVLLRKGEVTQYAAPRNPSNIYIMDYNPSYGYGAYQFDIQLIDTEYNAMDPANVYYVIFQNDSETPHEFGKPLYPKLSDPMTKIPYGFQDGDAFECTGATHTVFFAEKDCETIGVAVLHEAPDGHNYFSEVMWSDGRKTDVSSVKGMTAEDSAVVSTAYYTLDGTRVTTAPERGLYLRVETLENGSRRASKHIIR